MSGAELLKQIKALPERERKRILKSVLALSDDKPARGRSGAKRVRWPDVEARAKRILGKRVLPNLVLLDRDENGR
jgi:hypothetical protein